MRVKHRQLPALVALIAILASVAATASARAAPLLPYTFPAPYSFPTGTARLAGTFKMLGLVTTAVNVRGEQPGQHFVRTWRFTAENCGEVLCTREVLRRQRAANLFSTVVLHLHRAAYTGSGSFDAPLRCLGRTYRRGETVPYTISVRVTRAVTIDGIPVAWSILATYTNRKRIDHTRCPLGESHDAANYFGIETQLDT